ncbi:MAG TPA: hypothetical protein VEH84_08970 [Alphaproteobacteria bacterium]|nr:hypothetical protein [Alphaproteobacteria bacterium]
MAEHETSQKDLAEQARRDLAGAGSQQGAREQRSHGGLDGGIADQGDLGSSGIGGGGLAGGYDDAQGSQTLSGSPVDAGAGESDRTWDGRERRDPASLNEFGDTRRATDTIDYNRSRTDVPGGVE